MNSDKLLDAIGMVDDDLLVQEKRTVIPFRRKLIVLVAAVLVLALSVGVVAAEEGDFQQWTQELGQNIREVAENVGEVFLKVFEIETPEKPPESTLGPKPPLNAETTGPNETTDPSETTKPSEPMLEYVTMVDIEGAVYAHYFSGTGYRQAFEGGFYTFPERERPPKEATFWEITKDGIVDVGKTRVDFVMNHGGKDFRILFDYAVLAGKVCIMVWPEGLDEDPYGNGWNAQPIGNRTDIVLLSIPVHTDWEYTHDYFILNLETLEMTDLFEGIPVDDLVISWLWITDDLRYALMNCYDLHTKNHVYGLCDLEEKTFANLEELTGDLGRDPYWLDDRTLIANEYLGDERITVARYDIPTGERTVIVENVPRSGETGYRPIYSRGAGGQHGLLYEEDGSVWLIDLRTNERNSLAGLDMTGAERHESPDGKKILFAYHQRAKDEKTSWCYPKIGLLDPKTGEMKVLTRDISGNAELLFRFLDSNTVVISSRMDEKDGYYLYVYEFT